MFKKYYFYILIPLFFTLSCSSESKFGGTGQVMKSEDIEIEVHDEEVTCVGSMTGDDLNKCIDVGSMEGRKMEACFAFNKNKNKHNCNRAKFDVLFFGTKVGQINLNNGFMYDNPNKVGGSSSSFFGGGYSVFGGKFTGKWRKGKFEVNTRCQEFSCHRDASTMSLIGEVKTKDGRIMWLKIDQGQIEPDKVYEYDFTKFTLIENKPTFGQLCELN